jgi:Outer membrane protein beta-barrel domain
MDLMKEGGKLEMKKFLGVVIVLLVISVPMFCQENKAEVFGGYQYTRINPGGGVGGENFNGWNGAATYNMTKWLGLTGDFSGAYKSISGVSLKTHTFMFGPTVSMSTSEKFKPFVHALFGGAHSSASVSGSSISDTAFATALGGGVDVGSKKFAVRIGQFDYLMTRFGGTSQNNFRYSAGVVLRF